jgi:ribosomal protein L14E/L6E/L27E
MPVDLDLGQLVRSPRGRDRGRYYLVVEKHDNRRVKLVDGTIGR